MTNQPLVITVETTAITPAGVLAEEAAIRADAAAAAAAAAADDVFAHRWSLLDQDTRMRQEGDLDLFARYLGECRAIGPGYTPATLGAALPYRAQCWSNVNAGLVAGFVRWMLQEGYAIGSINVRLATVKVYARLAAQAGAITEEEARLIATNRGYGGKAARNMDASRVTTRKGTKKAEATPISDTQVVALKTREDTPCAERPRSLSPTRASKNFSPWPATKSTRALSICSLSEFGRS